MVIERLAQTHGPAEIEEAEQAARQAEARVGLVFGSTGGVVTAGQVALGGFPLTSRRPEGADQQEEGGLKGNDNEEQFIG